MNVDQFWQLVDSTRGFRDRADSLAKLLEQLTPDEIVRFRIVYDDLIFIANKVDLWGAASVINGGCSDDGFYYFREALIELGRPVFDAAVRDRFVADIANPGEEMAMAEGSAMPTLAWTAKTGREEEAFYEAVKRREASNRGDAEREWWSFSKPAAVGIGARAGLSFSAQPMTDRTLSVSLEIKRSKHPATCHTTTGAYASARQISPSSAGRQAAAASPRPLPSRRQPADALSAAANGVAASVAAFTLLPERECPRELGRRCRKRRLFRGWRVGSARLIHLRLNIRNRLVRDGEFIRGGVGHHLRVGCCFLKIGVALVRVGRRFDFGGGFAKGGRLHVRRHRLRLCRRQGRVRFVNVRFQRVRLILCRLRDVRGIGCEFLSGRGFDRRLLQIRVRGRERGVRRVKNLLLNG
jgi:hypothetical protein